MIDMTMALIGCCASLHLSSDIATSLTGIIDTVNYLAAVSGTTQDVHAENRIGL